ncbi:MAG: hypothetical protein K2Q34_00810 [Alphaproteobacteria bacterium]|nr:hypothetical protein [Alphaproteobacteria bacterium]
MIEDVQHLDEVNFENEVFKWKPSEVDSLSIAKEEESLTARHELYQMLHRSGEGPTLLNFCHYMFHTPHISPETAGTWLASKFSMKQLNDAHIALRELIYTYQNSTCLGWFSTVGLPFISSDEMMDFSIRFPESSDRMRKTAAFTAHAIYAEGVYKVSFFIHNSRRSESSAPIRNEILELLKNKIHNPVSWTLADSETWNAIGNNSQGDVNVICAYLNGKDLKSLHSLLSLYENIEAENAEEVTSVFPRHSLRMQGFYY